MRQAEELYRQGKLTDAVENLQAFLREHPSHTRARSFLFELLCFAGEFERARKHLAMLASVSKESRLGTAFYFAAIAAELERQACYEQSTKFEVHGPATVFGTCNGREFSTIRDLDFRLGASLEFLAAGHYHRIAFQNLARVKIESPHRARDLYWLPAKACTGEALGSKELVGILIPMLYPLTYLFDDDQTRLGRVTDWAQTDDGTEIPCGQRILLIDGVEVPLLEVHSLEFGPVNGETGNA